ncbi:bifunctional diguanylate cyclase/phosphodiesterase [Methylomagnum ishizawai]|uniref:bifunctional diguanylate cyclase/phosphodiesterase n=1 Tax=Methylomagnum ishizawai TaxID=1760988 RepID=UPI001C80BF88|nr:PAS domain S-box protein [Methylomagnum ishizawai]
MKNSNPATPPPWRPALLLAALALPCAFLVSKPTQGPFGLAGGAAALMATLGLWRGKSPTEPPRDGTGPDPAADPPPFDFQRACIEQALEPILWMDAQGRLLDANLGAARMLGYDQEKLRTLHLADIDTHFSEERWQRHWDYLRRHHHIRVETEQRPKEGPPIPVEMAYSLVVHAEREYGCAIVRDLRIRKRLERAFYVENLRNSLLLKTASDGIHVLSEQGQLVLMSDAFCRMLGYSRGEMKGMHVSQWDARWTRPELMEKLRQLLCQPAVFDTQHRRKDGSLFEVEVSATAIQMGERWLLFCASRDVSERKAAERALRESEARFRELSDAAPVMIWTTDTQGRRDYFNRGWLEFRGRPLEAEAGDGWRAGLYPEDRAASLATHREYLAQPRPYRMEYRLRRHDGTYHWLVETARPRSDERGRFLGFVGCCIDISDMKRAELELRLVASAFEANEAIIITDAQGVIQRANRRYCESTGYALEEIVGQHSNLVKSGRHDTAFYREMWQGLAERGFWQGEVWNRRKSGEVYPQWLSISAVRNTDGDTTHYVGAYLDLSRQKQAEEQVRRLAYYDTLTGLPNRRLLYDRLQQIFAASARLEQYGALLFIDLDNFKVLNDTAGHDVGDALLIQVAEILSRTVRSEDTVARLGGDEFVIVLERLGHDGLDAAARAEQVAAKVIATMADPYTLAGHEHHVTLSIGVALFKGNEERPESFLKRADAAMYQAKAAGRNTACFFDPAMAAAMEARVALLAELRKARVQGQLQLHCQPVVDAAGRIAGGEILLRWDHPERGWIGPSDFIPLAEESGLIIDIGTWVLETACGLIRAWEARDWLSPDFFLSINISPRQFRQPDFPGIVHAAAERAGISPHRLKLEITEGMLISKLDDVVPILAGLRAAGVRFSLDDFGTGYSSLAYLQRLPLDQLKIDRSFVLDLHHDANDAVIVRTIISMGQSLALEVVAEGVETLAQFEFLKEHGCGLFQGYLFGQPVDTDSFGAKLRARAHPLP